jgi:tRNA nucleotidyltransferase/poly(A) polymerase
VEDWTEKGIRDLILQQIATPKNSLNTLLQDPIRILRAIRFAAQLSFDMSPELFRAALDTRVKSALEQKVSRDSIGKAIDDMLGTQARDPSRGIQLLLLTNLIDAVFPIVNKEIDSKVYISGLECLSRTQSIVTRIFLQKPDLEWDITKRRFLWYSAFFKPLYELMSTNVDDDEQSSKRNRRRESAFYQLLDSLKRPKSDVQAIESILKGANLFQTTNVVQPSTIEYQANLNEVPQQSIQWKELSELRWTIYNTFKPIGTLWKEATILALASTEKDINVCVNEYISLITLIERQLLLGEALINKPKPLLNGSQLRTRVPSLSQIDGREFKDIIQAMEEWQVCNVYCDIEKLNTEERGQLEEQLVKHLVATFPEHAETKS